MTKPRHPTDCAATASWRLFVVCAALVGANLSSTAALATSSADRPAAAEPQVTVSIWTEVKVSSETVLGKDILASCSSSVPSRCEQLHSLAICPAPRLGQTKRFAIQQLKSLLGADVTVHSSGVAMTITRPAQLIKRAQLEEAFRTQLKAEVQPYMTDRQIILKSLTSLGPITVEDAPVRMSFPALLEPLPKKSWFRSEVVISQPSLGEVASFPVAIHLATKLRVVSLARNVAAGDSLSTKDLRYSFLDQHRVNSRHFLTISAALGLKAKATLREGTVLVSYQWHNPSLVEVRKKVDVALKGKNFAIRTTGTTLEAGRKGDTIWLQVGKKAKKMKGKIVSSSLVEVSL